MSTCAVGLREVIGERPFDLCGFSFGSLVAGHMAADARVACRRLALLWRHGPGRAGAPVQLQSLRGVDSPASREEVLRHNLAATMLHDPAAIDEDAMACQAWGVSREGSR